MADYSGNGGVMVGGCADTIRISIHKYKWGEGSVVFVLEKAKKGIMEPVAIKEVRLINNRKTFLQTVPLYVDMDNWLWNEDELITQEEALEIATEYVNNLDQSLCV